jgi:hypothetical protein
MLLFACHTLDAFISSWVFEIARIVVAAAFMAR